MCRACFALQCGLLHSGFGAKRFSTFCSSSAVSGMPTSAEEVDGSRYKSPLNEVALDLLSRKTFSANTNAKINWAVNLYCDWFFQRCKVPCCDSRIKWSNIEAGEIAKSNLAYALSCFLSEVRKKDGSEYPGDSLYQLIICLQFYLERTGHHWKLIDGEEFLPLKFTLDNLMKERAAMGLGKRKSSSPISIAEENTLWEKGVLGTDCPDTLHDTLLFLLGLHLALRGGKEHKDLRAPGFESQLSVQTDSEGVKFLLFTEDVQRKTNQGGLTSRKKSQGRTMKIYGHSHPEHNIVNIFKKYVGLLPPQAKSPSLYKHSLPKTSLKPNQWYADKPVGINVLKKTVRNLAEKGGLSILPTTPCARMYAVGVDEQLIMETTGHKSECVCQYKRTSDELLRSAQESVSNLPAVKVAKREVTATVSKPLDGYRSDIFDSDDDKPLAPGEPESVSYVINEEGKSSRAHKNPCLSHQGQGSCTDMCAVLKKVDDKTDKGKKKRVKLSLKLGFTHATPWMTEYSHHAHEGEDSGQITHMS